MSEQKDLFPPGPPRTRADQIFEAFCRFHKANPHVWRLFVRFAHQIRARRDHYSARAILHRIRWEVALTTTDEDCKVNDHQSVYYARMYMAVFPEAEDFFQLRRRTSQDRDEAARDQHYFHTGPADDEQTLMRVLRQMGEEAIRKDETT